MLERLFERSVARLLIRFIIYGTSTDSVEFGLETDSLSSVVAVLSPTKRGKRHCGCGARSAFNQKSTSVRSRLLPLAAQRL